ncbi:MAG: hypothetical protein L3J76_06195 [Candidatus Hydrothermae bacterium]|nr:hypothetical protein [Candidatus Hydrothermae bacterium]
MRRWMLVLWWMATPLWGIPSFARQVGAPCSLCHTEHGFPGLTVYGRQFMASGYTLLGGQPLIEGAEGWLSLPAVSLLSVETRFRLYRDGSDPVRMGFPERLRVFLGGRIGPHAGFLLEGFPYTFSIRIPLTFAYHALYGGVVPFTTDTLGPAYFFEVMNTGAAANLYAAGFAHELTAQGYVGTRTRASGVGVYVAHPRAGLGAVGWVPVWGYTLLQDFAVKRVSRYVRAYVFPLMAPDRELGLGIQSRDGVAEVDLGFGNPPNRYDRTAFSVDLQGAWRIGRRTWRLFAASAHAVEIREQITFPPPETTQVKVTKRAVSVLVEVDALPSRLVLYAGHRSAVPEEGGQDDALGVGLRWMLHQNVKIQVDALRFANRTLHPGGSRWSLLLETGL